MPRLFLGSDQSSYVKVDNLDFVHMNVNLQYSTPQWPLLEAGLWGANIE